jgi:hypothetical protein
VPIPYAYLIKFSGPQESQSAVIEALTKAGLAAESCDPIYDTEADLGWVSVLAHEGNDAFASQAFQERINAQAGEVVEPFGYRHRSSANVIANFGG